MASRPRIAIIGGGIGGLAAAIALRRAGLHAEVYEQASQLKRVGAGINLGPNAVRVLEGLGVGQRIRVAACCPQFRISRAWDSGEITLKLPMGGIAERKYGFPQLSVHRADLLSALRLALRADWIHLGRRLVRLRQGEDSVELEFAEGRRVIADAVIGADGVHSVVRASLFGGEAPRFTGIVSYRSIVPVDRLPRPDPHSFTKWWGPRPDSLLVTFSINAGRDFAIVGSAPQTAWRHESWSMQSDVGEFCAAFGDYHEEARATLAACEDVLKTALYERDPLPCWTVRRVTLLGDACHPMTPFMGQGAAMALEDAAVLARCLERDSGTELPAALKSYELTRRERTARIQTGSRENRWLKSGGDADWVFGYDAWQTPLMDGA